MTPEERTWLRSLPLLLAGSVLMVAAAWAFFQGEDNTASVAAFTAGLILLGAWLTTAIVDWWAGRPQRITDVEDGGEDL
jgi:thiol:disulfide interchange protein